MGGRVSANSLATRSWRRSGSVAAVLAVIPGHQTAGSSAYDIKKEDTETPGFYDRNFSIVFGPQNWKR